MNISSIPRALLVGLYFFAIGWGPALAQNQQATEMPMMDQDEDTTTSPGTMQPMMPPDQYGQMPMMNYQMMRQMPRMGSSYGYGWGPAMAQNQQATEMPMMNQDDDSTVDPGTRQPMRPSGQYGQIPMMNYQAMQNMMRQMPQMGPGYGYGPGYGFGLGYGYGGPCGMPMMSAMGSMPMHPQMMQMGPGNVAGIEQQLQKIESLLAQILEAQKKAQ